VNAVLLVTRRELMTRIRERGFQVSLLITLAVLLAIIVLPKVFGNDNKDFRVGLAGTASRLQPALEQAARTGGVTLHLSTVSDVDAARSLVTDGKLDAVVDGDREVIVKDTLDNRLEVILQGAYQTVVTAERLAATGIDPGKVSQALAVPALNVNKLKGENTADGRRQGVAFFAVVFLYGQLFGYAMWVALGVVEEKASRVIELLLSTLRPWQVLAGKVAGIGLLGLGQFFVLGAAGLAAALATGTLSVPGEAVGTILHVLVWFLLGYAFYACLAAGIAAQVSRQEDLQNAIGPMQILLVGSFFVAIFAGQSPTGRMAEVLSYVPPFSAMVMPLRVAAGAAGPVPVLVALGVMLVATLGLVRLAAWVYAGAVLRTGSKVRLGDALRAGRADRREPRRDDRREDVSEAARPASR